MSSDVHSIQTRKGVDALAGLRLGWRFTWFGDAPGEFLSLAGLHGDGEGRALEAGYEVEGSSFGMASKPGVASVGCEGAVWFCDSMVLGSGWAIVSLDREMTEG